MLVKRLRRIRDARQQARLERAVRRPLSLSKRERRHSARYHQRMPRTTFPRDRFDDVADDRARIGAHRAENPHLRGWVVFLWAARGDRRTRGCRHLRHPHRVRSRDAVSHRQRQPDRGRHGDSGHRPQLLGGGAQCHARRGARHDGEGRNRRGRLELRCGSRRARRARRTSPTTTVYYAFPEDEGAARGLAGVIGGAEVAQSDRYQPTDDPNTTDDESQAKQLAVVIGLDRVSSPAPSS